jgi:hypothetical protein
LDLGLTEKERAGLKPGTYIKKHSQDWLCHATTGLKQNASLVARRSDQRIY